MTHSAGNGLRYRNPHVRVEVDPHAAVMADAIAIQKLFIDISMDILTKIDTIHTQLTNVNTHLTSIEMGRLAKDVVVELEHKE